VQVETRRQFIRGASAAAAIVLVPAATAGAGGPRARRLLRGGSFDQGVMSGDPTARGITLWTHVGDVEGSGAVELEVARDRGFRRVVARRRVATSEGRDHTAKARVERLSPHEEYFFRFSTAGEQSRVGRFRTAPAPDSRATLRFALISCQEFSFGYFNAHALLAREDVDFVLNLGDYIYGDIALPRPIGVRTDPLASASTVAQYRRKYATYRSDRDLQKVHAEFPMVSCWDDHEVQNNYAGRAGDGESVPGGHPAARRRAAYRAFFEQMPTFAYGGRSRLYHRARFGRTVDLFVLDERQYRESQPCGGGTVPGCPEASAPRAFLGTRQLAWAGRGLRSSQARWKVVANEMQIMSRRTADGQLEDTDSWQGYLSEREALLGAARSAGDVVFVTGDVHEFIAGDVRDAGGRTVATEIVGSSITSLNLPETAVLAGDTAFGPDFANAREPEASRAGRLQNNPEWRFLDGDHHGYVVCEAGPSSFRATLQRLAMVRERSTRRLEPVRLRVERGQPGLAT
jgi:alkaline phosphatase D